MSELPEGHKRCRKCGLVKPLSEFYQYTAAHWDRGDWQGYRGRCKACMRQERLEYAKANAEQIAAYMRRTRAAKKPQPDEGKNGTD